MYGNSNSTELKETTQKHTNQSGNWEFYNKTKVIHMQESPIHISKQQKHIGYITYLLMFVKSWYSTTKL